MNPAHNVPSGENGLRKPSSPERDQIVEPEAMSTNVTESGPWYTSMC